MQCFYLTILGWKPPSHFETKKWEKVFLFNHIGMETGFLSDSGTIKTPVFI